MGRLIMYSDVFRRDESNIKIMPTWMIYSMPFLLLLDIVSLILSILNYGTILGSVSLVVFVISFTWSIISDKVFSLYENCRISFSNNSIIYEYELNRSVMPSSNVTTTIIIKGIYSVKVKRKSVVIKGSISRIAPLKKPVEIKKVELPIDFKERDVIIERLKERVE